MKTQDNSKANYWRKRDEHDTVLDLRMNFSQLDRLIRSYTVPYPCAKLLYDFYELPICKITKIKKNTREIKRIEQGKVIDIFDGRIRVKIDDCIAELELMTDVPIGIEKGSYIHPPTKYLEMMVDKSMTNEDKEDWLRSIKQEERK